ncbi:MAG TPA: ABC transporter ATP-binding protein [Vicinamibacterales bacterium]|nr:ABC transporter ATP-binding protein [Vicinamibacterales bacterium]
MPDSVIELTHLSRAFGTKKALDDVSLSVPRGSVFGLVGENGAGKSTLIKHILGLWRAQTGSVRVFGADPVAEPAAVLRRIGYLSEQPDLAGWMRVDELMGYTSAFYPNWDPAYAESLRARFALDPRARVDTLSKGQRAKLGLIAAQAHRPDLLLLDEPSSGLDPIVRRDILEAVIRAVADEGRTVLFSSHLLDEVERVSDHLAMLHHGRVILCSPLDQIKARHSRFIVRFAAPQAQAPAIAGVVFLKGGDRQWTAIGDTSRIAAPIAFEALGASIVEESPASLDEIFLAHAG